MRAIVRFTVAESLPQAGDVLHSQDMPEGRELSKKLRDLLDRALALYATIVEPRGLFEEISHADFARILGEGKGEVSVAARISPRAEALALFTATVGEPVCVRIRELFGENEVALGYMLDTVASVGAERLANLTAARFRDALECRCPAETRVLPYSPGYCGWPTSGQGALFASLLPGEIGISLNDSFLMRPLKSVSGVLVAGPPATHSFEADYSFCEDCATHECRARLVAATEGETPWTC